MDARLLKRITDHAEANRALVSTTDLNEFGASALDRRALIRGNRLEWFGTSTLRIPGAPASWEQKLQAAVTDLAPDAYVSHLAAAALLGFDRSRKDTVDVLVPRGRAARHPWATVHTTKMALTGIDKVTSEGLPCVSGSLCILQVANLVDHETLVAFIGSAMRDGWTSEAFLRRRLSMWRGRGVTGVRALDAALAAPIGHSELERRFLELVRRAGLPMPKLQVIYRKDGKHVARVDAEFPGNEIVELQGHAHHSTRQQRARDAQRHAELRMMGKNVSELTFEQVVYQPDFVVDFLRRIVPAA